MPVYYFMLIWVIIWGSISLLTSKQVSINDGIYERKVNWTISIITFSAIIFFAGLRSYGVADTGAYIDMFKSYPNTLVNIFNNIPSGDSDMIGFILLSTFIKTYISSDYSVWLFIIATISGICIVTTLYKYSENFGISVFLFMVSCQFTWMFNGMRQYLAVAILFASTTFIINKKSLKYFLIVLLTSTIHKTAIIMIPTYFIVQGEPWNKKTLAIIGIVICCVIFSSEFLNLFDSAMEQTEYAISYQDNKLIDDGVNIMTILVQSVPLVIAFLFRENLKDKYTPIINISINMSIIAISIYIVSKIVSSGILIGRIAVYFTAYNLILMPWVLSNSFDKNEKRLMYFVMFICYLVFFYYQLEVAWNGWPYFSKILEISYN
ncbi:EpsG family protein [Terrisporobacter glycolicus]|uniref:Transmembrane protein EpsG n=1 Tax=Terrisporobacter glycolicus ATCC 14880 = DSM 1288 TaxID=1121315 RepID=A0ABZ2ESB7_9FIRM|nr:EpsG family protein [Terrisporobacter glycolicus]